MLGLIAVAATVALTVLSYRFLERPFLRPRSDVRSSGPTERSSRCGRLTPSDRADARSSDQRGDQVVGRGRGSG